MAVPRGRVLGLPTSHDTTLVYGLRQWIEHGGSPVVLVRLPSMRRDTGLGAAVARLRRALRDVRDRTARLQQRWRAVAMAGMASGDGRAFVLIRHPGIAREEITDSLRRRWPALTTCDVGPAEPSYNFAVEHVVELALARRGVEPMRIVLPPQRCSAARYSDGMVTSRPPALEPMPWAF
jgi:hypothetical protein